MRVLRLPKWQDFARCKNSNYIKTKDIFLIGGGIHPTLCLPEGGVIPAWVAQPPEIEINSQELLVMTRSRFAMMLVLGLVSAGPLSAQDAFIAGVEPSLRPQAAPVLTRLSKDAAWYELALSGVSRPYPVSLRFLEDQGAWFNPFLHAGMTGPYDIRGWHD